MLYDVSTKKRGGVRCIYYRVESTAIFQCGVGALYAAVTGWLVVTCNSAMLRAPRVIRG